MKKQKLGEKEKAALLVIIAVFLAFFIASFATPARIHLSTHKISLKEHLLTVAYTSSQVSNFIKNHNCSFSYELIDHTQLAILNKTYPVIYRDISAPVYRLSFLCGRTNLLVLENNSTVLKVFPVANIRIA